LTSVSPQPPVFCSIVDSAYFLGAVALVNSLRLTGHAGEIVFLDGGLTDYEREFLEEAATVRQGSAASGWLSVFAKPLLGLLHPDRVVVILDTDLVVTDSFEPLVQAANEGAVAVFTARQSDPPRWFAEWAQLFSLREPLRHAPYTAGSCVALSTGHWQGFLERWYQLGQSIAEERSARPFVLRSEEVAAHPVGYNEMDVLNALLMSEVPGSAIRSWPHSQAPAWADRHEVRVVDARSLRCEASGQSPLFLEFSGQPKPWQRGGWLKARYGAFNQLLRRVLTRDDVPLQLPPDRIPPWLRRGVRGRLLEDGGAAASRLAYGSLAFVPTGFRTRVTSASRARLSRTGARGQLER
jgi:hypothetical protein